MPAYRYRYRYRNQYMSESEGELIFNSRDDGLAIKKLEIIDQALEKEDVIVTRPCSLESGNMKQLIKGVRGFVDTKTIKSWW